TDNRKVDERLLEQVINHVPDIDITFHRAFDHVDSQIKAYHILNKYKTNVKRILTSGGQDKAADAVNELRELVSLSRELDGPNILVGSGVSPDNLTHLHQSIGANEYHIGSGVRIDGDFSKHLSEDKMKVVKDSQS